MPREGFAGMMRPPRPSNVTPGRLPGGGAAGGGLTPPAPPATRIPMRNPNVLPGGGAVGGGPPRYGSGMPMASMTPPLRPPRTVPPVANTMPPAGQVQGMQDALRSGIAGRAGVPNATGDALARLRVPGGGPYGQA